ncbi:unannotated protein [freshwater metagenome]|uniref:Unannotated protein n=1 Tax=freshwater metagenome TaxID=449393 RepID=A0A6J7XRN5_9ZZZZ|nr:hypothetical protein [Actinomycetota bacterium]
MSSTLELIVSVVVVIVLTVFISSRFRISSRYERSHSLLNNWNSLDMGIDPTDEEGRTSDERS